MSMWVPAPIGVQYRCLKGTFGVVWDVMGTPYLPLLLHANKITKRRQPRCHLVSLVMQNWNYNGPAESRDCPQWGARYKDPAVTLRCSR